MSRASARAPSTIAKGCPPTFWPIFSTVGNVNERFLATNGLGMRPSALMRSMAFSACNRSRSQHQRRQLCAEGAQ